VAAVKPRGLLTLNVGAEDNQLNADRNYHVGDNVA
jgi:hypothetical protein